MISAKFTAKLAELETRLNPKPSAVFDLAGHLFPKQSPFGLSTHRQRTASCSRRAGKSEGCAAILLQTALTRAGSVSLYITKTRLNAKRIIWGVLKRVNRDNNLGGNFREGELCGELPNGSTIYLCGANNRDEIEKFRGMPIGAVVVDESQMLLAYLEEMVDQVLAPALMDYDGMVVLAGTPSPVPSGYFYDCIQNPAWEHYEWTVFDNPWILKKSGKTPQQHLDAELARRGVTVDDPSIQREWFGRWVYDPNSLVFRYDAKLNDYAGAWATKVSGWSYCIGVDLGFDDADAIAVLGWPPDAAEVFLVEEFTAPKQTITQLQGELLSRYQKYEPLAVVMDAGGLGKKIAEELSSRPPFIPIEAAEKERKLEHIELLNDAMRTGAFKAKKESTFAKDCMLVEWNKKNPEKMKISDRYHSDILDAALYAYRKSLHWLHERKPLAKPVLPGSTEWHAKQAASQEAWLIAEQERAEQEIRQRKADQERYGDYGESY